MRPLDARASTDRVAVQVARDGCPRYPGPLRDVGDGCAATAHTRTEIDLSSQTLRLPRVKLVRQRDPLPACGRAWCATSSFAPLSGDGEESVTHWRGRPCRGPRADER